MNERTSDAEQEASRWIARLESSDVSLDDHRKFRQWLDAAPQNRPAYEAVSKTWDRLDALRHLSDVPLPKRTSRRGLLVGTAAGALALAAGVALLPVIGRADATPYETAIGERKSITLADGSTAELNADTRMRVALSERERRVYLDQGEALFDVRQDADRPFIVETAFGDVRVRGTAFLVKIGVDGARATIIHGVVEGIRGPTLFAPLYRGQTVIAQASQEISFQPSGLESAPLPAQTLQRRLAWREGMLAFDGETLREAAFEIERQTGVHFEFADPSIGDLRIGGYISATDLGGFAQLIEENLHLKTEREASGVMRVRRS